MQNDKTYNGWTNYETWRVALEACDQFGGYHDPETVKHYAQDFYLADVENTFAEGLIDSWLSEVNWDEISESLRERAE